MGKIVGDFRKQILPGEVAMLNCRVVPILALIMLLIILFRPNGLAGGREVTWPFGRD